MDVIHHGEEKRVPILEMYQGPGKSLLDSSRDLLVRFHFRKTAARESTAFKRVMRPQGVALPVLSCAVWIQLDETLQNYADARICIAPMGPKPLRVTSVEEAMIGQPANDATIAHLIEVANENLNPRTSAYRATADYRRELIGVLLRRTLLLAANRVRTGEIVPEIGA
jgi:CO/xanthine dehydrogenase FAD-binding subunit